MEFKLHSWLPIPNATYFVTDICLKKTYHFTWPLIGSGSPVIQSTTRRERSRSAGTYWNGVPTRLLEQAATQI
jgi:hypothetical protein